MNRGTTLVVWLKKGDTIGASHYIHHNYFGQRQPLGENGGETIRVGDSSTSLQPGLCRIENNWFTHCDGEIEIISNKSCGNEYRGNVFESCDGTLTLRHGKGCRVAISVMRGIVDTPLNGYAQVKRAQVRNNTIIGCAEAIALGVKGANTTLDPVDLKIESNHIDAPNAKRPSYIPIEEAGPTWRKSG